MTAREIIGVRNGAPITRALPVRALSIECPRCHAAPGERCRSPRAPQSHDAREQAAIRAAVGR